MAHRAAQVPDLAFLAFVEYDAQPSLAAPRLAPILAVRELA